MTQAARDALAVALVGLAAVLLWTPLGWLPPTTWGIDLWPTWVAAHLYADGVYEAVYHPSLWIPGDLAHPAWRAILEAEGIPTGEGTTFTYSPVYLLLVGPFMRALSIEHLCLAVLGVNGLSLGVIGVETMRLAGVRSLPHRLLWTAGLALSVPVMAAVCLGQNTLWTLALLLLGWRVMHAPGRTAQALGVALWLLACACKPWAVLLLGLLPVLRSWRVAAGAAAGWVTLFVLLPALVVPEAVLEGYRATSAALLEVTVAPTNNISLRAFLLRMRLDQWTEASAQWTMLRMNRAWLAAELPVLLAVLAAAVRIWWVRRPSADHTLAAGLALVLLPLGVCWTHYLVFCAPMVALLLTHEHAWIQKLALVVACWAVLTHLHHLPTILHFNVRNETLYVAEHPTWWALRALLPWLGIIGLSLLSLARGSTESRALS